MIGLSLRAVFIQKKIDRIVNRFRLDKRFHDKKESLSEVRRTAFGSNVAFTFKFARLVYTGIHAGKGSKRFSMAELGNISDFSNQLGTPKVADTWGSLLMEDT